VRNTLLILLFELFTFAIYAQDETQTFYVNGMHIHQDANITVFGDLKNMNTDLYNDGHLTMIGDSLMIAAPMQGTGTLEMLGFLDQHITHQGDISVDTLILNNVLDISYANNITIGRQASFVNGVLHDNYDLGHSFDELPIVTFTENADVDSTLVRDDSHIEGLVVKEGNTRFVFPIGDAYYYRPAAVSNFSAKASVMAHYFYEWIDYSDDDLQFGAELFKDEYWYINSAENTYDITLSYDDRTSTFDTREDGVNIAAYDGNFDNSYSLLATETVSMMDRTSYTGNPASLDSSFVWYGFARVDPRQSSDIDLFVPQILSPNGDGRNDHLEIQGLANYPKNKLVIFNRYGDILYEKENYDNTWGGLANQNVIGGKGNYLLPSGTYFVFFYDEGELIYKDFVQLLRTE